MSTEPTPHEDRIGTPEDLAAAAAQEFGRRKFAGRHPFLTFAVSPIPAVLAVCLVIVLIGKGIAWLMLPPGINSGMQPTTIFQRVVGLVEGYALCLAPFALGWMFLDCSRRAGRPVWGLIACGLLAFLSLNLRPAITAEFNVAFPLGGFLQPDRMVPTILPLAFALWVWWRIHYPPTQPVSRTDGAPQQSSAPAQS